mmetsp:Transcript_17892/g.30412  ORF Transcript_17892/g.30412 Transcript_17892/m.30412 type:complete len:92 (+) Transcript_17892:2846-3121(+)
MEQQFALTQANAISRIQQQNNMRQQQKILAKLGQANKLNLAASAKIADGTAASNPQSRFMGMDSATKNLQPFGASAPAGQNHLQDQFQRLA